MFATGISVTQNVRVGHIASKAPTVAFQLAKKDQIIAPMVASIGLPFLSLSFYFLSLPFP